MQTKNHPNNLQKVAKMHSYDNVGKIFRKFLESIVN